LLLLQGVQLLLRLPECLLQALYILVLLYQQGLQPLCGAAGGHRLRLG
jgi:hypothetical protein